MGDEGRLESLKVGESNMRHEVTGRFAVAAVVAVVAAEW